MRPASSSICFRAGLTLQNDLKTLDELSRIRVEAVLADKPLYSISEIHKTDKFTKSTSLSSMQIYVHNAYSFIHSFRLFL